MKFGGRGCACGFQSRRGNSQSVGPYLLIPLCQPHCVPKTWLRPVGRGQWAAPSGASAIVGFFFSCPLRARVVRLHPLCSSLLCARCVCWVYVCMYACMLRAAAASVLNNWGITRDPREGPRPSPPMGIGHGNLYSSALALFFKRCVCMSCLVSLPFDRDFAQISEMS